jgi:hypothetical protein
MLPENDSNKAPLLAIYEFLERVVDLYGDQIEVAARCAVGDSTITPSNSAQEIGRQLEELLLASIKSTNGSLGTAWKRDKEQGQGQQPFESKAKPESEEKPTSTDVLAAIFSVLIAASKHCPTFLVYLPATASGDTDNDRLITRAIESSVTAIVEADFEVARTAILFLKSMVSSND